MNEYLFAPETRDQRPIDSPIDNVHAIVFLVTLVVFDQLLEFWVVATTDVTVVVVDIVFVVVDDVASEIGWIICTEGEKNEHQGVKAYKTNLRNLRPHHLAIQWNVFRLVW
jgi:hypothetical protein